jgi:hypothetical protein
VVVCMVLLTTTTTRQDLILLSSCKQSSAATAPDEENGTHVVGAANQASSAQQPLSLEKLQRVKLYLSTGKKQSSLCMGLSFHIPGHGQIWHVKMDNRKPTAIAIAERLVGALCSPRPKALLQKTYI